MPGTCPGCRRSANSSRTYTTEAQCDRCHGTGKVCRVCHRSKTYCSCNGRTMSPHLYNNRLQTCGSCAGTGRARVSVSCNNPYHHTGR